MPNLRHDPDAAVVVTEVWQLFVSEGYAAFGGSKLEQWTQPLEPGTVDTALWSFAQVDIFLEVRIRPYNFATFIDLDSLLLQASKTQMIPKTLLNCFLGLMSGMRYGHTSTSCILGNVCSCAHCCTAANGRDGHTGLVYLVRQTSTNHTFCVDSALSYQGPDFCCTAA